MDVQSKQDRNSIICLAYLEDGYSQIEIANYLGLSKSAISMIINSQRQGCKFDPLVFKKITLEINNSIYDDIMFFLENIPKNLVNIKKELQVKTTNHTKLSNSFNPRDFFGVANSSKVEIDSYLQQNQNEWDSYIDKRLIPMSLSPIGFPF